MKKKKSVHALNKRLQEKHNGTKNILAMINNSVSFVCRFFFLYIVIIAMLFLCVTVFDDDDDKKCVYVRLAFSYYSIDMRILCISRAKLLKFTKQTSINTMRMHFSRLLRGEKRELQFSKRNAVCAFVSPLHMVDTFFLVIIL